MLFACRSKLVCMQVQNCWRPAPQVQNQSTQLTNVVQSAGSSAATQQVTPASTIGLGALARVQSRLRQVEGACSQSRYPLCACKWCGVRPAPWPRTGQGAITCWLQGATQQADREARPEFASMARRQKQVRQELMPHNQRFAAAPDPRASRMSSPSQPAN